MREVKLRAWDESRGKFQSSAKWVEFRFVNGVVKAFNFNRQGAEVEMPVCQYTGLQDKNGIDIYDGDILYHSKQGNCAVEYGNKYFDYAGFTLINSKGMTNTLQNPYIYEIIGSIHENSELV